MPPHSASLAQCTVSIASLKRGVTDYGQKEMMLRPGRGTAASLTAPFIR